jgi:spore coat protein CotH
MAENSAVGRRTAIAALAIGFLAALCADRPAAQQLTAADLFDDSVVQEIRLSVNSKDLAILRAKFDLNTFYPADLTWRGQRVRNVGIRSRGTGSRNAQKLGLLIDMDRYTTAQTFLGLPSLVLDNVTQDPSFMHEILAMAFFRRMGEPAPREAFCRVYINNVFQGLYTVVETIDPVFTQRTLGESAGYLYEYHYRFPFFATDPGDDLSIYRTIFEPQNHQLESDQQLYEPLRELFREINAEDDPGGDVWRERVEARLDLAQTMKHVAIEAFLAENDGFLGFAGMNNFYLYRDAAAGRFRLLAWDKDFAFTFLESSVLRAIDENVLISRAFERPDLRAAFLDVAEAAARSAAEDDWLANAIERYTTLITASAIEDPRKPFTVEEFGEAIKFLRMFGATRSAFVLDEVSRVR